MTALDPIPNVNPHATSTSKRKRGRPSKRTMPDPIPDTPENVMKAIVETPPKRADEWRYLKDERAG